MMKAKRWTAILCAMTMLFGAAFSALAYAEGEEGYMEVPQDPFYEAEMPPADMMPMEAEAPAESVTDYSEAPVAEVPAEVVELPQVEAPVAEEPAEVVEISPVEEPVAEEYVEVVEIPPVEECVEIVEIPQAEEPAAEEVVPATEEEIFVEEPAAEPVQIEEPQPVAQEEVAAEPVLEQVEEISDAQVMEPEVQVITETLPEETEQEAPVAPAEEEEPAVVEPPVEEIIEPEEVAQEEAVPEAQFAELWVGQEMTCALVSGQEISIELKGAPEGFVILTMRGGKDAEVRIDGEKVTFTQDPADGNVSTYELQSAGKTVEMILKAEQDLEFTLRAEMKPEEPAAVEEPEVAEEEPVVEEEQTVEEIPEAAEETDESTPVADTEETEAQSEEEQTGVQSDEPQDETAESENEPELTSELTGEATEAEETVKASDINQEDAEIGEEAAGEEEESVELQEAEDEEAAEEEVPERSLDFVITYQDDKPVLGGIAHFTAIMEGYEDVNYLITWQQSTDDENWVSLDEHEMTMDVVITEESVALYWRVHVDILEENQE